MEDSITPAEVEFNGPEADKREARAEAERPRRLELASQNSDKCFDYVIEMVSTTDEFEDFIRQAIESGDGAKQMVGKRLNRLIEDAMANWAMVYDSL